MQNKLTELNLRTLKPSDVEQTIGDGGGLWVRVLPADKGGSINFYYRFTIDGRERRYNCGTYPETRLAVARKNRDAARHLVETGIDPVEQERLEKLMNAANLAAEKMEKTVSELFVDWDTVYLSVNRKDKGESARAPMRLHILPTIGHLRAKDVKIAHIIKALDAVVAKGTRRTANMLLSALRQMFRHGMARGIVETDPTLGLSKKQVGGKETPKTRNLSIPELVELAAKLPGSGMEDRMQTAIWLILATGVRVGELTKARWTHVDENERTWRIPAENSKNAREHVIDLSDFALQQIDDLKETRESEYLLAGRKAGEHMDEKSISKAIRDRIRQTPLKNRTSRTGSLALPGGPWSAHDLRRTFSSRLGDLGVDPHIIERCLNHVPQGIVGVYQRQEYRKERKAALAKLGRLLQGICRAEKKKAVSHVTAQPPAPPYNVQRNAQRNSDASITMEAAFA